MRQFGNDAPEFFCFQIGDDEQIYKIPLAASMNNKMLRSFNETNNNYMKQVEWLRTFIGDVVDDLTPPTTAQILKAWSDTTAEEQGASVGESSASSD